MNKATAEAYEGLLERLLVAERIPAWHSNRLKRLVHQPKRYLIDAGLLGAALRVDPQGAMRDGLLLGRLLETFVAAQLRAELPVSTARPRLHHLRTEQGRHEVDLIAELGGGRLIGIEVKASGAPPRRRRQASRLVARGDRRPVRRRDRPPHWPSRLRAGRPNRRSPDLHALGVTRWRARGGGGLKPGEFR